MHELQRQHYLAALGLETYMPRFLLPFAPISVACPLPALSHAVQASLDPMASRPNFQPQPQPQPQVLRGDKFIEAPAESVTAFSPVDLNSLLDQKNTAEAKVEVSGAAEILAQLAASTASIEAFSLSVWRPMDGLMILDARNTQLPLPTDALLENLLRSLFPMQSLNLNQEILRWPVFDGPFIKRSAHGARTELQTWLMEQQQIWSIRYLWLLGENAATYMLPESARYKDLHYQLVPNMASNLNALIAPSLHELLLSPMQKRSLFHAIRKLHTPSP